MTRTEFNSLGDKYGYSDLRDVDGFAVLARLFPEDDILAGASHDCVYLYPDPDQLLEKATNSELAVLARCGIFIDPVTDALMMFV